MCAPQRLDQRQQPVDAGFANPILLERIDEDDATSWAPAAAELVSGDDFRSGFGSLKRECGRFADAGLAEQDEARLVADGGKALAGELFALLLENLPIEACDSRSRKVFALSRRPSAVVAGTALAPRSAPDRRPRPRSGLPRAR